MQTKVKVLIWLSLTGCLPALGQPQTCPPISDWHHDLYGAYSAGAWTSRVPIASYHPLRGRFLGANWQGDNTWGGSVVCHYKLFFMNTPIEMHTLITYAQPPTDKNWQPINGFNYSCAGHDSVANCPITALPYAQQVAKPCIRGPIAVDKDQIPLPFRNPQLVCPDSNDNNPPQEHITTGNIFSNFWYWRELGV